jgi:hypothetical protein
MAAPDEKRALAALQVVQRMNGAEVAKIVDDEIGTSLLGVMKAVARAQVGDDEDAVARAVHLLTFGWLLRREIEKKPK